VTEFVQAAQERGEVLAARMRELVDELSGPRYGGWRAGSESIGAARVLLANQLRRFGAEVTVDHFPIWDKQGGNIYARRLGAPGSAAEVLLSAHLDGVGDLPDRRRPRASGNASRVAVVLEAASVLAADPPPGIGVSVALLDGEEVGALGSARHAEVLARACEHPMVVNVDGAGRIEQAVAVEAGGPAHGLLAALDRAGRAVGVRLRAGRVASDNRRYAATGLAAVGLGAGMPGYHGEHDTADRVDPDTLVAMARLVIAAVRKLRCADGPAQTGARR
jgi:putative aminopeptidase FrvX